MTTRRSIPWAVVLGVGFVISSCSAVRGDEPPVRSSRPTDRSSSPRRCFPGRDDGPLVKSAEFDATLRELEQDITRVRGLAFMAPVVTKVIPRPKGAAQNDQGCYSVIDKVLFLYDDVGVGCQRGVLIHGMVGALQDQNFDLAKLLQTSFGSDDDDALAALIAGDATFTRIELLKKDDPSAAALLEVPWEKMKDIRSGFRYIQGARYVRTLKERGGWEAVNAAYRNPPRSTAAVLHPEGVRTIDLGPGTTRGELAILQMLATNPETAPLAVKVAAGWRGDRVVEHGAVKSWVVAFGSRGDALEFQAAMAKLRMAQNPRLQSFLDQPGAKAWHDVKGTVAAVLARGDRVFVVEAPDDAACKALLDRLEGPPSLVVYAANDKSFITFGQLIDRLLEADLICIGESHASDLHHRVPLQIIKAVFVRDERLGVGMETFQRPFQRAIDRYLRGELTEGQFVKTSEYQQRCGFDWSLYRPVVEFCRGNGIAVAALNAPQELIGRVSEVGFAGLTNAEKAQLGDIDFSVKEHRDYWFDLLAKIHGKNEATAAQKERFYQVMTVWDEYMAASAARFQQERRLRRLVVLAGSGHIDRGFGIPARTAKRTGGKVITIGFGADGDSEMTLTEPGTDYILYVSGKFVGDP